MKIQIQNGPKQ